MTEFKITTIEEYNKIQKAVDHLLYLKRLCRNFRNEDKLQYLYKLQNDYLESCEIGDFIDLMTD